MGSFKGNKNRAKRAYKVAMLEALARAEAVQRVALNMETRYAKQEDEESRGERSGRAQQQATMTTASCHESQKETKCVGTSPNTN